MENFIKQFNETAITDIALVGGKNASLGEMYNNLAPKGLNIPEGFAVTVAAYKYFITYNNLQLRLKEFMAGLERETFSNLNETGQKARKLIMDAKFPSELDRAITHAYDTTFAHVDQEVAVRSSATAEDLADASFAGQHDSFLNIKGPVALIYAVKCCFASLYTDRAIKYREDKGFDHNKVFLSVGIQQMVRSDIGCSGIGFTLEPESGFKDVVHLAGTWGLGENIVQGLVTPDEFIVFKPSLIQNKKAILQKNLGSKGKILVYNTAATGTNSTVNKITPRELSEKFVLSDNEIEQLARWAIIIEEHYNKPMDFEWAKDGLDNKIYIIQARPETVHSQQKSLHVTTYKITEKSTVLATGEAIGTAITSGYAKLLASPAESHKLNPGDILITDLTSPDWDPILKKVAGIVTNKGGRTSHASIIARELGVVAIVGTGNATASIKDGDLITLSCAEGKTGHIYKGKLSWTETPIDMEQIHLPEHPKAMLIVGEPEKAFQLSFYPNHGVGLMRLEFIINNYVKVHPMALVKPELVDDKDERLILDNLTRNYKSKEQYFIDKLSQGVATLAAAFYPKEVIVRMSDFKTNEYSGLIGGKYFEPEEENPMLGFRGASRYYHERYREGFRLECEAMKVVRNEMGLTNVKIMIPFCRTVEEGKKVVAMMEDYGLKQHDNNLEIYVMAEIPSNVLLAENFAKVFDGFSIGSNDLTQLTLGIDRDSALIANLFDEQNAASKQLICMMIQKARQLHKKVGLCGQAASDSKAFTEMLVLAGIDSISFNPDALIQGIQNINAVNLPAIVH
ncbi:phosphoenolpyruvate synthase [Flavobacterium subsaxonicum]|uniref:Phosphoenolpyruvate synthase n=1 Tax=Flavobacterium subsaxonicum WB 4.1-42 = DSM 21790 TaxID=1121898 RepID=A0A0A2MTZ2_9FLAO|nr:phosphoenolpyruvate synthase [Flavobacterium subsaxonicum]KGO95081.1 phosphoenolpyruvate synthase [Flavobacterium subsaxonicum WB 4.1-42 = DSM 21790]